MAQITSGQVNYSHVHKMDDFGINKKAEVALSFIVDEGEKIEDALEQVGEMAKAKVFSMLGLGGAKQATAVSTGTVATPGTKTKADLEAEALAAASGSAAPKPPGTRGKKGEAKAAPAPETPAPETAKAEAGPMDEWEAGETTAAEPPREITDAELNGALAKKNGEIKNPQAIRDLIGEYMDDKSVAPKGHLIPQAKRAAFLEALKGLKAA